MVQSPCNSLTIPLEVFASSEVFVNFATPGSHRGVSTFFIEHNLFDQSELGQDIEL